MCSRAFGDKSSTLVASSITLHLVFWNWVSHCTDLAGMAKQWTWASYCLSLHITGVFWAQELAFSASRPSLGSQWAQASGCLSHHAPAPPCQHQWAQVSCYLRCIHSEPLFKWALGIWMQVLVLMQKTQPNELSSYSWLQLFFKFIFNIIIIVLHSLSSLQILSCALSALFKFVVSFYIKCY